jgi:hypothetical protein
LDGFLLKPMQRLVKYPLLLKVSSSPRLLHCSHVLTMCFSGSHEEERG